MAVANSSALLTGLDEKKRGRTAIFEVKEGKKPKAWHAHLLNPKPYDLKGMRLLTRAVHGNIEVILGFLQDMIQRAGPLSQEQMDKYQVIVDSLKE